MLEESFEQLNQKQCAAYLKKLKLPQEGVYPGVSGQADPETSGRNSF